MAGRRTYRIVGIGFALALCFLPGRVCAQTAEEDEQQQRGQVEGVEGEAREVELEAAITAEPARPLIQFTYSRPGVNFSDVSIIPSTRSFYPELRRGTGMEVGSPVIDLLGLFPGLLPGL
jgi:hypothetical protein